MDLTQLRLSLPERAKGNSNENDGQKDKDKDKPHLPLFWVEVGTCTVLVALRSLWRTDPSHNSARSSR